MAKFLRTVKRLWRGRDFVFHGPATYNQDGLATKHSAGFLTCPRFRHAYQAGKDTGSWYGADPAWRVYIECWAAEQSLNVEGDFVQCGVNLGGIARAIVDYLELTRRFYLLDTYSGLVDSQVTPAERKAGANLVAYSECYEQVCKTFADFPNAVIVRGPIPDTLEQVRPEKVAYLSIDMNCAAPEIAAAEYFWPLLSKGALVMLDDYGWRPHIEQKRAFDAFAQRHGISILSLPTGQGVMVKP